MLTEQEKQELCIKCQACCRIVGIPLGLLTGNTIGNQQEFYQARGIDVVLDTRYSAVNYLAVIPMPCPQLTPKGCKIYKNRPKTCQLYDGTTDPLMTNYCLWREENRNGT